MHPIEKVASNIPIFLCDLYKYHYRRFSIKVFLCGQSPKSEYHDLRIQLEYLLEKRMGCKALLGEDIEDFRKEISSDKDALTIEMREAITSDAIIMFLNSPGTIAELTAFVLHHDINPKLFVINNAQYEQSKSFISIGPLKLLKPGRLFYYDIITNVPSLGLVRTIDNIISELWYNKLVSVSLSDALDYELFIILALIHVYYPVRYTTLLRVVPFKEHVLRDVLGSLFELNLIKEDEGKYVPLVNVYGRVETKTCQEGIYMLRLAAMDDRFRNEDEVADYRLLLS